VSHSISPFIFVGLIQWFNAMDYQWCNALIKVTVEFLWRIITAYGVNQATEKPEFYRLRGC
jgi:hypothetical protein